jgi:hypothetical protein
VVVAVHGRTISGIVKWTDGTPVAGAVAKVYDNDVVGKCRMQQQGRELHGQPDGNR